MHVTQAIRLNWPIVITHPDPDCTFDSILKIARTTGERYLSTLFDRKSFPFASTKKSSSEKQRQQQQAAVTATVEAATTKTSAVKYTQIAFCFSLALNHLSRDRFRMLLSLRSSLCSCSTSVSFSWDFQCETVFLLHRHAHAHSRDTSASNTPASFCFQWSFIGSMCLANTAFQSIPLRVVTFRSLYWNVRAWLSVNCSPPRFSRFVSIQKHSNILRSVVSRS